MYFGSAYNALGKIFMDDSYYLEKISKYRTIISNIEDAVEAISTGKNKSVSVNTGQTTTSYTRKNIGDLLEYIDYLENRIVYYSNQLSTGNSLTHYVRGC